MVLDPLGLVRQVRGQPPLDGTDIHAFAASVVFHLIPIDFSQAEVV